MGKRIQRLALKNLGNKVLNLGYVGENEHTQIVIDCSEVLWDYSDAVASVVVQPPRGDMYPVEVTREEDSIIWEIADSDLVYSGTGRVQITFTNDGEIVKSAIGSTRIEPSIMATGPVPTPLENWMEQAEETARQIAQDAADGVVDDLAEEKEAAIAEIQQAAEDARETIPEDYTQLSDDVTELKEQITNVAQGIYVETESLPIVSIQDGADDQPMRSVEVAIEPVQDLHGYEYPWPAGGGKNLIPPIKTTTNYNVTFSQDGDYINISGTPSGNAYCVLLDDVVLPAGTYTLNGVTGASNASYRTGIKIADATSWTYNSENQRTFTLETESQVRIALFVYPAYGTFDNFKIQYQLERGEEVTPWTPYSNVCPISGWTGAKVTRTGINIWDEEWELGNISPTTGTNTSSTERIRSVAYIAVRPSTEYYFKSPSSLGLRYYDANKNFIGSLSVKNSVRVTPDNCYYLRFTLLDSTTYNHDVSINYPATDTEYHPGYAQTYEVTFPTEAGTVYGGTLDVASGKLVVDRIKLPVNDELKGSYSIGWLTTVKGNRIGVPIKPDILAKFNIGNDGTDRVSCNVGKVSTGPNNANTFAPGECCIYTGNASMFFRYIVSTDITSAEDAFAYLKSIGTEFVTPIAEPVEISLTPTEIKTLLGINNVLADAGSTAITYPADTKTYIDNRINSTRKLIAGIETGFVASKPYAVGDMLIIGDDLYKVASAIASGATITVGTNVTKTTVAEQLIALANA